MKPLRVNGHKVKCSSCHRKYAISDFMQMPLCGSCFRAFSLGLLTGTMMREEK